MDTLYKMALLVLFVFILLSNAKADKQANEENILNSSNFGNDVQYTYAVQR